MKPLFIPLLCLLSLLVGCQSFTAVPQSEARVRVYSEVNGDTLALNLTLEGQDSQSLSGANVSLLTLAEPGSLFPFNMTKNAYTLSLPALSGTYKADVDSVAAGRKSVSFLVTVLSPIMYPHLVQLKALATTSTQSCTTHLAATCGGLITHTNYGCVMRVLGSVTL